MDKEKEIEEMATVLPKVIVYDGGYGWDDEQEVDFWEMARNLINAGYGNIEQAVREFAEELKDIFKTKHAAVIANVACNRIDELIKEKFGEEVRKE